MVIKIGEILCNDWWNIREIYWIFTGMYAIKEIWDVFNQFMAIGYVIFWYFMMICLHLYDFSFQVMRCRNHDWYQQKNNSPTAVALAKFSWKHIAPMAPTWIHTKWNWKTKANQTTNLPMMTFAISRNFGFFKEKFLIVVNIVNLIYITITIQIWKSNKQS